MSQGRNLTAPVGQTYMLLNERPAKGMRGCLLRYAVAVDNSFEAVFRVHARSRRYRIQEARKKARGEPYNKDAWKFTDYRITNYDVDIVIDDPDAAVYDTDNGDKVLDYTSASMKPVPRKTLKKVISGKHGKSIKSVVRQKTLER
jgi:hypothetical protein